MNGAEALMRTASAAGVEVCFANPGTTEMALVAALDAVEPMRAVLCLFEGVCTGAADGYGRMADKPALALLHLGPGFANGIANLHNARRARSPVVNLIGDHATWHASADAPLTSDIVSLARPVSGWIRTVQSAKSLARDCAEAIAAAGSAPGQVTTLIVPADCQWEESGGPAEPIARSGARAVSAEAVRRAAAALRSASKPVLFLGGMALREPGLRAAARVAAKTGARLICETFPARIERGAALPAPERLPYFPEQALEMLAPHDTMVLAGAASPVAFFGYPGMPSSLVPEGRTVEVLAEPTDDVAGALEALAQEVNAPREGYAVAERNRPQRPTAALNPMSAGAALAALLPDDAIVVDEAATTGLPYFIAAAGAARHTHLGLTGGSIGQGLPCATGAAVACPDRRVISFQADGSAMYTLQALWTQAREGLNVTTLLCNNRSYRILQIELHRSGVTEPGRKAKALTDLSRPDIDWVAVARGMGVPGARVESADALVAELGRALREPGPNLIELML
jgi:acetolactate synthase-1/2/3 large subunit